MKSDTLGDRMKSYYEDRYRLTLTRRVPVILRADGRAFHSFTKKYCGRPFDEIFYKSMIFAATTAINEIQGAKFAYVQSDEISILITDYDDINTQAYFDYNIQKMTSIIACIISQSFIKEFNYQKGDWKLNNELVCFDSRVFNIPENDVMNYFIWRQKDWIRNSLQMYCRSFFSHKELENKNHEAMHEMLHSIGKNWTTDLDPKWKNGVTIIKGNAHPEYPIFSYFENPLTFVEGKIVATSDQQS